MSWISKLILDLLGWKIILNYPPETKKMIYAVVPHTSNWDFPLGILSRSAYPFNCNFIGKHTLFKFPLGPLMRWLGGIPINRNKSKNFVQQIVEEYQNREKLAIAIAPEGTRKKVDKLKTGFYHIAKQANIPIVLVQFNYEKREMVFRDLMFPSDDQEADFEIIHNHFKGIHGKIAKNSFGYTP